MSYKVSSTDLTSLTLSDSGTVEDVLQNVAVILSTPKGSVPLMRDFGLDMSFLDRPIPVAKVMLFREVREALEIWEPRATLVDVEFIETGESTIKPCVEVEISV